MPRDYVFYGVGFDPKRFGVVVVPARRVLRRLLRPMLYRQVELFRELGDEIEELKQRVETLEHRADELANSLKSAAALGWDHVALTRRLAALEDKLGSDNLHTDDLHADPVSR